MPLFTAKSDLVLGDPEADQLLALLKEYAIARLTHNEVAMVDAKGALSRSVGEFVIDQVELSANTLGKWLIRRLIKVRGESDG